MERKRIKLSDICNFFNFDCNLREDIEITGINTIDKASESEITFLDNLKYEKYLPQTRAGVILIKKEHAHKVPSKTIPLITDEPYLKVAILSSLFVKVPWVDGESEIDSDATIHPSAVIGKGARIGENTFIGPNVVIGPNVRIGNNCYIYPNVSIYRDTIIGDSVRIHSGSVIGSDGFGYAHTKDGKHVKIHHLGKVVIEDDVEIGANTTVDRAVFGETRIKRGTKIDNLVQVGHNCEIGENSILVSQVGLSGSTKLGRNVIMGGQSATAGHLSIADFTTIAARGGVTKDVKKPGIYSGFPLMPHDEWLRLQATLSKLTKENR